MDYYATLGLSRNATEDDIQRSYRKLSLKYHPDKSKNDANADSFAKVAESYDVLSDPNKRAIYNQYGVEGLKNGVPASGDFEGYAGGYEFHGRPEEVFQKFFGGDNPFQDFYGTPGHFGGEKVSKAQKANSNQLESKEHVMELSLEELYLGSSKKIKILKNVLNPGGLTTEAVENVLRVDVKRGWKEGTKIIFAKQGDQSPNAEASDVVLVVKEKHHPRFQRKGNDLHYNAKMTLLEALTGSCLTINTLDDRVLRVPVMQVVNNSTIKVVENEGMPLSKNPDSKGNLVIHFDIEFPKYLNEKQKECIRQGLE